MSEIKWIKLSTDIFNNRKIRQIESMPDADAILVIWFKILALAGTVNESGLLMITKDIPYTDEMLANQFGRPINTIRLALKTFEQFEMIEVTDNVFRVANWEKYQNVQELDKIREQTRKRVAKHRERQKMIECNGDLTRVESKDEEKECIDGIDYNGVVNAYHSLCPSYPKIKVLSDARKKAIRESTKTYSIEDFKRLFEIAESSSFLKGQNARNWTATFDWLIINSNMVKVLEGNYNDEKEVSNQKNPAKSKFRNFEERSYNMGELTNQLLKS